MLNGSMKMWHGGLPTGSTTVPSYEEAAWLHMTNKTDDGFMMLPKYVFGSTTAEHYGYR